MSFWSIDGLRDDDYDEPDDEPDYDEDPEPEEEDEPEVEVPYGFCINGCGKELCSDCRACHDCDGEWISLQPYDEYPCFPDHPGIPPELKVQEGL